MDEIIFHILLEIKKIHKFTLMRLLFHQTFSLCVSILLVFVKVIFLFESEVRFKTYKMNITVEVVIFVPLVSEDF